MNRATGSFPMSDTRVLTSPFPPWISEDCRVLILGSFPSIKAIEAGYYYGNPHNRFYQVLGSLLGIDLVVCSGEEKRKALIAHGVALHDIVLAGSIVGSSDASLRATRVAEIDAMVKQAPIRRIFLNGNIAGRIFTKHFPHLASISEILPSTSPANARMRLDDLIRSWAVVIQYLRNDGV